MNENIYDLYSQNKILQESIKTLRMNIEFSGIDNPVRSVCFASVAPGDGKSTMALCLAIAMAQAGKSTLIVENDFRRSQLANRLKVRAKGGIVQILSGTVSANEALVHTSIEGLYLLDTGGKVANPVELLSSQRYAALVKNLQQAFDFVVFDAPPIGTFIDSAVISARVDGVVLVIRSGATTGEEVRSGIEQFDKAGARIIGAVLNGVQHMRNEYYGRYYYNGENRSKGR